MPPRTYGTDDSDMHASKGNPHHAASQWCAAVVGGKWRLTYAVPRKDQPVDGLIEREGKVPKKSKSWELRVPRAGAREASCADFGVGVWDFNPKPE